ncbi:MAG: competence protein, partial [Mycobacterium sp.]|nr:competence protein [Mycobacterium sp.]
MTPGPLPPDRMDLRLVPAALTAWAVTAAGIVWRAGPALACLCTLVAAGWWAATWRWGTRVQPLRAAAAGVIGAAVIGAGFGLAVGLRADAVDRHPVGRMFGTTAAVTLTATESP